MHTPGDDACPSSLVARAESSTVVTVEVFIEQQEVAPVWVTLKFLGVPVDRSPFVHAAEKNAVQPSRELFRNLVQVQLVSRARRAFDGEIIAVIHVVHQECSDDEPVDGHPYRPSPV